MTHILSEVAHHVRALLGWTAFMRESIVGILEQIIILACGRLGEN